MDFKIVSKNNLGVVTVLLLVVILSQAKFFNFLLDTALGRAMLIVFILIISYMNKILGVVAVLFIIIMFNNSDIGYMEGFTSNSKPMKNDVAAKSVAAKSVAAKSVAASEKAKTTNGAAEGHDIIGTESTIKRGKQSNTIPATKTVGVENFAPFSGSYSDSYSSF